MTPSILACPALKPVFYFIARAGLALFGWQVKGRMPSHKKFVLIAAPHTSNWDFVFFMLAIFKFQVPVHWMGKHTMFLFPFKQLLKRLGGIPIDRTRQGNTVHVMAEAFNQADRMILTIAPSGTRQHAARWKTGFYTIAMAAKVPISCGFIDYKKKIVGIGPTLYPSGNFKTDMQQMDRIYQHRSGRGNARAPKG